MHRIFPFLFAAALVYACATANYDDPLRNYEQVAFGGILDAPTPQNVAPENRALVTRGEYLVELLGCGSCHTDGALIGRPGVDRSLAGKPQLIIASSMFGIRIGAASL